MRVGSLFIAAAYAEGLLWVDSSDSIVTRRTAGIGAERKLTLEINSFRFCPTPAIDRPNGSGGWDSCRSRFARPGETDDLKAVIYRRRQVTRQWCYFRATAGGPEGRGLSSSITRHRASSATPRRRGVMPLRAWPDGVGT